MRCNETRGCTTHVICIGVIHSLNCSLSLSLFLSFCVYTTTLGIELHVRTRTYKHASAPSLSCTRVTDCRPRVVASERQFVARQTRILDPVRDYALDSPGAFHLHCTCISIQGHIYVYVYTYTYVYIYICTYMCTVLCMNTCMRSSIHPACVHACTHACMPE